MRKVVSVKDNSLNKLAQSNKRDKFAADAGCTRWSCMYVGSLGFDSRLPIVLYAVHGKRPSPLLINVLTW